MPFFCRERFWRVTSLAMPAALGALIDMLQVLIDFILVGFLEVAATASIGIALQFTGLFYTLMGVFFIGSNALMSRFLGAADEAAHKTVGSSAVLVGGADTTGASKTFGTFTLLSAALSVPALIFAALFCDLPFSMMGSETRVVELGSSYLFILAFALPSMMINQIAFSAFSAAANIKTPLYIKLFSNAINIALSFILIFGAAGITSAPMANIIFAPLFWVAGIFGIEHGFGVSGAAAATVISFYIETICYFFLICVKSRPLKPIWTIDKNLFARGLKIGIPAGLERLFLFGTFLVFMRIISDFGTEVMAGYQIGLRIESIAFMPGIGFTIAAMSLTGRALGAKKPDEAEKDALFTALCACTIMGFAGLFMVLFPVQLARCFTDDLAAIEAAKGYLICVGISQIPLAASFVLSGALRGAGDSRTSLKINLYSMWIFRIIPAIILAWYFQNVWFVWLATLFETFIRGAWLYRTFKRGKWRTIGV